MPFFCLSVSSLKKTVLKLVKIGQCHKVAKALALLRQFAEFTLFSTSATVTLHLTIVQLFCN